MKTKRLALLSNLIEQGKIASQADAVKLLAEHGVQTTQATVSRDFEELKAVKLKEGHRVRYAPHQNGVTFGMTLNRVLRESVLKITAAGNMVVIKTPPGHANLVAGAIDRSNIEAVAGTIAGDDTVFVCASDGRDGGARKVASILEGMSNLSSSVN